MAIMFHSPLGHTLTPLGTQKLYVIFPQYTIRCYLVYTQKHSLEWRKINSIMKNSTVFLLQNHSFAFWVKMQSKRTFYNNLEWRKINSVMKNSTVFLLQNHSFAFWEKMRSERTFYTISSKYVHNFKLVPEQMEKNLKGWHLYRSVGYLWIHMHNLYLTSNRYLRFSTFLSLDLHWTQCRCHFSPFSYKLWSSKVSKITS